ncbi:hypothetical protein H2198_010823 [Neophaeococcomyces mojaviensis]|uniref:Uncharacterized protein n=1 Tax=Neophaeococcomyces mojaviensis TaxID=3383035 RepID=A0ACC2ZQF4_9EURO|nr:hypothetical protein H2198_010823 [Knufia sp. JES_112]
MAVPPDKKVSLFQYQVLKAPKTSIRTLQLLPTSTLQYIKCTLTENTLGDGHTCLSYTWGVDHPTHPITINDQGFLIRDNLYAFLQECIRRDNLIATALWIDAVCINQTDLPEKNIQVSRMGEIYEQAKEVIIWLGIGNNSVQTAFDCVKAYADSPLLSDLDTEISKPVDTDAAGNPVKLYWDTYDTIASLPYWRRMWIVQELLLAGEAYLWYGSKTIHLPEFLEYMNFIQSRAGPPGSTEHIGNAKIVRSSCGWLVNKRFAFYRRRGKIITFQLAFAQLRKQLCYDPRDFVYALRALDEDLQDVPVEYEKDLVFLMPKLFEQDLLTSEVTHAGLLVLERLALDVQEVIRRTNGMLSGKTWEVPIDQIGVVVEQTRHLSSNTLSWEVDWSACRSWSKGLDQATYDDGMQALELVLVQEKGNVATLKQLCPDIRQGDVAIRFHWLSMVLIYRHSHDADTLPESAPMAILADQQASVSKLTFHTAFTIHPNHRHRTKTYLNAGKQHASDEPLQVERSEFHNLSLELQHVKAKGPSKAGIYHSTWTWLSLLNVWALKDLGFLRWRLGGAEPIGTWDEEERKARTAA